jgi:hypothetical protein
MDLKPQDSHSCQETSSLSRLKFEALLTKTYPNVSVITCFSIYLLFICYIYLIQITSTEQPSICQALFEI